MEKKMKINYNKNPLYTTIDLDENEKKELWYKIKLERLEDLLYEAHFYLEEGSFFNLEKAKLSANPDYFLSDNDNEKSSLDQYCDRMLESILLNLKANHIGDCTCVPCSCLKCYGEGLLGINTLEGLGKHSAYKIDRAFGENNERTLEEAIDSLKNYNPQVSNPKDWEKLGGYEQYIPRWTSEAKLALDWLVNYKENVFKENSCE